MEQIDVYILRSDGALLPDDATPSSQGWTFRAHLEEPLELNSMARAPITDRHPGGHTQRLRAH